MRHFLVAVFLALTSAGAPLYAQCTLPREKMGELPAAVRQYVEMLYSAENATRANGAHLLGKQGIQATGAIPYLVNILPDTGKMSYWEVPGNPWAHEVTSPGLKAAEALVCIGPSAIDPLLDVLKNHPDVQAHITAGYALGEFREPRAASLLAQPPNIWQYECLDALVKIRDPKAIPAMLSLYNQQPELVKRGNRVLIAIGAPSVEPLINHLKTTTNPGRFLAVNALGQLGDARAVDAIAACLKEPDATIQLEALRALLLLPADQAKTSAAMLPLLSHADWQIRHRTLQCLARFKDAKLLPRFQQLLKDPDVTVRGYAALAIGGLDAPGAADAVLPLLKDKCIFPRKAALAALVMHKDVRGIQTIAAMLPESDAAFKVDATNWLANIGTPEAVAVLAPLTALPEPGVREAAQQAIRCIGASAAAPYAQYLNSHAGKIEWGILGQCCSLLAELGPDAALPIIREYIRATSWEFPARIGEQLPKFGERIIDPIVEGMKGQEENWSLMERGTSVLAALDSPRVLPHLVALLDFKNQKVSDAALAGLRRITKQQFGKDPAAWREWLKQHPQ